MALLLGVWEGGGGRGKESRGKMGNINAIVPFNRYQ